MNSKDIIFKKIRDLSSAKFTADSKIKDLEIDSLDFVTIISELEEEFDIAISDDFIEKVIYVRELIAELDKLTKKK